MIGSLLRATFQASRFAVAADVVVHVSGSPYALANEEALLEAQLRRHAPAALAPAVAAPAAAIPPATHANIVPAPAPSIETAIIDPPTAIAKRSAVANTGQNIARAP